MGSALSAAAATGSGFAEISAVGLLGWFSLSG
jgi:hypothetical protein